jgi:STE24 endopeptidase
VNTFLIIILAIIVARYALDTLSSILNVRHLRETLPESFVGIFDDEKYTTSQRYLRTNTRFGIISDTVSTVLTLAFLTLGGFNVVDQLARSASSHTILSGLLFVAILMLISKVASLPFALYDTFVIEARFGFNKTTPRTYAADYVKGLVLVALIGGPVFAGVIWFFETTADAWLYVWIGMSALQLLLMFVAPIFIMPLFNKFTPLAEGELRSAIEAYSQSQNFTIEGIYTMDGSRRSAKSNAFFTGFGRSRRIVLFDTLIEKQTTEELVAIVAHEMGHYRCGHIPKGIVRAMLHTGVSLYLLSYFIESPQLFEAFGMQHTSVYAGIVFFGFLYTPIAFLMGLFESAISRKHEYEADAFAVKTAGNANAMISALQKLSVDNLSNLTPHPLTVFLEYSHPPVIERIAALRKISPPATLEARRQ